MSVRYLLIRIEKKQLKLAPNAHSQVRELATPGLNHTVQGSLLYRHGGTEVKACCMSDSVSDVILPTPNLRVSQIQSDPCSFIRKVRAA